MNRYCIFRNTPAVSNAALCALILFLFSVSHANAANPQDVVVQFGGSGAAPGMFADLVDIAIGPEGDVYTLEGEATTKDKNTSYPGNLRVQKFDATGKFLAQFPIADPSLPPASNSPRRLAVDTLGNVYVTQQAAGIVEVFGGDGTLKSDIKLPYAYAIKRLPTGAIAVLPYGRAIIDGHWKTFFGTQILTVSPQGLGPSVSLSAPLDGVDDFDADKTGDFFVVALKSQLYEFRPDGKLVRTIGAGSNVYVSDGSEVHGGVAVDSKGCVYTQAGTALAKFDNDFKRVAIHEGKYNWFETWTNGAPNNFFPLAIDPRDQLWGASIDLVTHPLFNRFHYRPVVIKIDDGFFVPGSRGVSVSSTDALGLRASIQSGVPNNIAYAPGPIPMDLVIAAAHRNVDRVDADYTAYDMYGNTLDSGRLDLSLVDNEEERRTFSVNATKYGWFTVVVNIKNGGETLLNVTQNYGVTRNYPGMISLTADNKSTGWEDSARQVFSGLPLMRLHPAKGLDKLDADITAAQKYGASFFCQFSDVKDCDPDNVRAVVTRFKGRVPIWEVMNEPNFSMSPEKYVALLAQVAPIIKECDPAAKIMGPDVCGIQLPWYQKFYDLGGNKFVDILSEHDYEGHESIDPNHWRWKYAALRKIMAAGGDADKPLWQTERAITGVRGGCFLPAAQAVRVLLHRDLLDSMGVPSEHNSLYYLNEGGYSSVPSYIWSSVGPHPAVLALRTRAAMVAGLTCAGDINFGPTGNKICEGLRFTGSKGGLVILRNLGALDQTLGLHLWGGRSATIVDAFGNEKPTPPGAGPFTVDVTQMPTYIRLAADQSVSVAPIDLGPNLATDATFTYSGTTKSDISVLNNSIFETIHAGNPHGDTGNPPIFRGDFANDSPNYLEMDFPAWRTVSRMIVYSLRADNQFCALLDFDVQAFENGAWVTIDKERTQLNQSTPANAPLCTVDTWLADNNMFVCRFAPVTTTKLRIAALRTTLGFAPDSAAAAAVTQMWGGTHDASLDLKEVEVYGPANGKTAQ